MAIGWCDFLNIWVIFIKFQISKLELFTSVELLGKWAVGICIVVSSSYWTIELWHGWNCRSLFGCDMMTSSKKCLFIGNLPTDAVFSIPIVSYINNKTPINKKISNDTVVIYPFFGDSCIVDVAHFQKFDHIDGI